MTIQSVEPYFMETNMAVPGWIFVVTGFLLAGIGTFLIWYGNLIGPFPSRSLKRINTTVEFLKPIDGDDVGPQETVTGRAENLNEGDEVWVFVYSHVDFQYYPYPNKVNIREDGEWSLKNVHIGAETDNKEEFNIIAVLCNIDVQNKILNYLEIPERAGLGKLPPGSKKLHAIHVTRQP